MVLLSVGFVGLLPKDGYHKSLPVLAGVRIFMAVGVLGVESLPPSCIMPFSPGDRRDDTGVKKGAREVTLFVVGVLWLFVFGVTVCTLEFIFAIVNGFDVSIVSTSGSIKF